MVSYSSPHNFPMHKSYHKWASKSQSLCSTGCEKTPQQRGLYARRVETPDTIEREPLSHSMSPSFSLYSWLRTPKIALACLWNYKQDCLGCLILFKIVMKLMCMIISGQCIFITGEFSVTWVDYSLLLCGIIDEHLGSFYGVRLLCLFQWVQTPTPFSTMHSYIFL